MIFLYINILEIARSIGDFTTPKGTKRYQTGDMNGVVYPVRGGMEDWAYSGGWEGFPIINTCNPNTYRGYDKSKTNYTNNPDALKSIMFLLEVSHNKYPPERLLGRNNIDCILNLRKNAFFNNVTPKYKLCLNNDIDGYVTKILRLSLSLIDILEPYINFSYISSLTTKISCFTQTSAIA